MEQLDRYETRHVLFLKILIVFVLIFVAIQLYRLSSLGTKGEDLSIIKNSQSQIKVENEILKARVMALKSNQAVLDGLNNRVEVVTKPLNFLDPQIGQVSAQF
jgi:hypothetical protein